MLIGRIIKTEAFNNLIFDRLLNHKYVVIEKDYSPANSPTLIVGYANTLKYFPNQSILKNEIKDNLFWCFSYEENMSKYFEYCKIFKNFIIEKFIKNIPYYNIDFLINNTSYIRDKIVNNSRLNAYMRSEKTYYYNGEIVIGLDSELRKYDEELYDKMEAYLNSKIDSKYDDTQGEIIGKFEEIFERKHIDRIIPVLI
jgi:hypothetical protein